MGKRSSTQSTQPRTGADGVLSMNSTRRALAESAVAALTGYVVAADLEVLVIRWLRPTEWELASVSDVVLATALGVAVYLWRCLLTTRQQLIGRERAELVLRNSSRWLPIQDSCFQCCRHQRPFECAAPSSQRAKSRGFLRSRRNRSGRLDRPVADVSGKGIPAGWRLDPAVDFPGARSATVGTAQIAGLVSAAFLQDWRAALYATCIITRFDLRTRTLTYTNAGHPKGILMGSEGIRYLDRGGPPLGLLPGIQFDQELLHVDVDDTCLLVTDGITEALDGTPTLEHAFATSDAGRMYAADLCEAVMAQAVEGHGPSGDPDWDDDRTVFVVRMGVGLLARRKITAHRRSSAAPALAVRGETGAESGGAPAPAAQRP